MTDTYEVPEHGWTCFHCGETFKTVGSARDHFGAMPDAVPGCLLKVETGDERGLLMALRKAEAEIERLHAALETQEHEAECYHSTMKELERYFDGARTPHQAYLVLDSMEGRALAAEEKVETLQKECDGLREYKTATEYWKLDPHDAKERTAFFNKMKT